MTNTLLPGFGGRVTLTVDVVENEAATITDALDASKCAQLAVQLTTYDSEAALSVQAQQTFDGVNWADYGSSQVMEEGDVLRFDPTDGPIGVIRFKLTAEVSDASSSSSHAEDSAVLTVVGFPMQWSS